MVIIHSYVVIPILEEIYEFRNDAQPLNNPWFVWKYGLI